MTGKIAWFWATQYSPDCGQLCRASLFCLPCSRKPKTKMKALCFWLQHFCNILVLTFIQSIFTSNTKHPLDRRPCSASSGSTREEDRLKLHTHFLHWCFSRSWNDPRLFCSGFPVDTFFFSIKVFQRENNNCTCSLNQGPNHTLQKAAVSVK